MIKFKISKYKSQCWCNKNDLHHRHNGPAIIYADGSEAWYQNGLLHRDNGPAIVRANGREEWWCNGVLYRIIYSDGGLWWSVDGMVSKQ